MKAVVNQSLSDILRRNARFLADISQVNDAFVRDQSIVAGVNDGVILPQSFGYIIRVQDGNLCSPAKAGRTQHRNISP